MSDTGFDGFGGAGGSGQATGGKEKIGPPDAQGPAPSNDDPSRSSLHYGAEHRGEVHQGSPPGVADAAAPGPERAQDGGASAPQSGAHTDAVEAGTDPAMSHAGMRGSPQSEAITGIGPGVPQAPSTGGGVDLGAATPPHAAPVSGDTVLDGVARSAGDERPGAGSPPGVSMGLETGQPAAEEVADGVPAAQEQLTSAERSDPNDLQFAETEAGHASSGAKLDEVNEAPTDVTLSNAAIAVSAEGAVVGSVHAVDPNAGDSHSYTVSDDRFEVSDGVLRLREGQSLGSDTESTVTIEVTATDPSGSAFSKSFEIEVVDVPELSPQTGFHARYFDVEHALTRLDEIDWSGAPTHEELVGDIDYENGRGSFWEDGATDTFGAQITGHVEVEEGGTFTFNLGGDDGAVLYVNGVEVIENDGLHSYHTRSGEIDLEPGTHHIEVRYFENYGYAGLKLEWEGPGIDGPELVTAPALDDAQTVNGMPIALDLGSGPAGLPDNTRVTIEGLPEGTLVEAGDQSATVDPDGSADITGWDMSVVTVTTPLEFTGSVDAEIFTTVTTGSGHTAVSSDMFNLQVSPAVIEPMPVALVGGFEASYFDVDQTLLEIDDVDWSATPTHTEMVREINYENGRGSFWEGGATDTFGAKLEGMIRVEEGGSYDFHLGGDDGVVLYVNGVEVIEHDGLHVYQTRSGEIDLEPGTHHVEVRYFENYGVAGLKLEWSGPDTDGREVVQADPDLLVAENGTLTVGLDVDAVSDAATIQVHGLPAHTILVSDDATAVSDGGPVDISGWNIDAFEIAPPPGYEGEITGQIVFEDTAFNGEMITSQSDFSITVGENVEDRSADGGVEDLLVAEASQSAENSMALDDAEGDTDPEQDDVMDQPVEQTSDNEAALQTPDGCERYDW